MLPSLIRFSRSGLIQYLTLSESFRRADDQRYLRAVPVAVEGGFCCGIPCANHRDLLPNVGVRLAVVVRDLRKILTGHIQEIGLVEKTDRDNHVPPAMFTSVGLNDEIAGIPADGKHPLVQANVELLLRGNAAIVLDGFFTRWLVTLNGKWIAADLDQNPA